MKKIWILLICVIVIYYGRNINLNKYQVEETVEFSENFLKWNEYSFFMKKDEEFYEQGIIKDFSPGRNLFCPKSGNLQNAPAVTFHFKTDEGVDYLNLQAFGTGEVINALRSIPANTKVIITGDKASFIIKKDNVIEKIVKKDKYAQPIYISNLEVL